MREDGKERERESMEKEQLSMFLVFGLSSRADVDSQLAVSMR